MTDIWKSVGDGVWPGSKPSSRFPVYTRGNAGEVYPNVMPPLTYSLSAERSDEGMQQVMRRAGSVPEADFAEPGVAYGLGIFGGYAYLNLSLTRVLTARFPGARPEDADVAYLGPAEAPATAVSRRTSTGTGGPARSTRG